MKGDSPLETAAPKRDFPHNNESGKRNLPHTATHLRGQRGKVELARGRAHRVDAHRHPQVLPTAGKYLDPEDTTITKAASIPDARRTSDEIKVLPPRPSRRNQFRDFRLDRECEL